MSRKIAVVIVHGVGTQGSRFAGAMMEEMTDRFADHTGLDGAAARDELIKVTMRATLPIRASST